MQKYDIQALKFVFDIVQTVIMVAVSIYVWIVTNTKVNADRISELETRHNEEIDDLTIRLTSIETKLDLMPDKRSMHNLHQRLNDQSDVLHNIKGELKGISDNNAMILKTLIK